VESQGAYDAAGDQSGADDAVLGPSQWLKWPDWAINFYAYFIPLLV
jgi:hypothetical protein